MNKVVLMIFVLVLFGASLSLASVKRIQNQKSKQYYILVNGVKKGPYSFATRPYFSKVDRKKWVFVFSTQGSPVHFSRNQIKNREQYVQTDSKKFGPYDEVYWRSIEYTPTKSYLYFVARKGKNRFIIMNGKKYGPFSKVKYKFYFYNNDRIWAVAVVRKSNYYSGHRISGVHSVLINGKAYGKFKMLNSWDLSSDLKTLIIHKAYVKGGFKKYRFNIR